MADTPEISNADVDPAAEAPQPGDPRSSPAVVSYPTPESVESPGVETPTAELNPPPATPEASGDTAAAVADTGTASLVGSYAPPVVDAIVDAIEADAPLAAGSEPETPATATPHGDPSVAEADALPATPAAKIGRAHV